MSSCWANTQASATEAAPLAGPEGKSCCGTGHGAPREGGLAKGNQDAAGSAGAEGGWEQAEVSAPQEAVRDLCVFQSSRDRMLRGGRETDFLLL